MGWGVGGGGGGGEEVDKSNQYLTFHNILYGIEELDVIGKCHLSYHQCHYCKCFYSLQLSGLSGRVECHQ